MIFIWSRGFNGGGIFINLWLTAFSALLFLKAAFRTWGRYIVAGSADTVHVFSGIGALGVKHRFNLKSLSEIRLRTQFGRRGTRRKGVVIHAERTFCFGEELSDEQRQYLAHSLLLRRRSTQAQ